MYEILNEILDHMQDLFIRSTNVKRHVTFCLADNKKKRRVVDRENSSFSVPEQNRKISHNSL